ncbi:xanthine dehydrogenase small subunit [Aquirhabdus sp.]|uniref:xanthine dehydrogenase small subunit n=1 Tax=Aquirhabdus sp. TaxID=2824160 RepID=UPI00396C5D1C
MSSRAIQFYFRGEVQQVEAISPTRTVLQYLREDCHHTGTKEGCAEGDCGACTVVVAELASRDGKELLQLRTVNSCIQFLPTLDGKALFTVEDLAQIQALQTLKDTDSPAIDAHSAYAASKALHPIQQAMVDHHASQCGFCTPGFVMSLWAMYENQTHAPTRTEATEHISGNLCRCTGYRPILDAAIAAYDLPRVTLEREPIISTLKALEALPSLSYHIAGQRFFAPRSRAELAALRIEHPQGRLLAGSTDVGLWITKQGRQLGDVIYLGHVADLKRIDHQDAYIEIGAMVSLTDAFATLTRLDTGWTELARRFASEPIKNAGTLGGNVANGSPIGDSMPALITQSAEIVLQHGASTRRLPLEDFYLDYQKTALLDGEFVAAIRVPISKTIMGMSAYFHTYKIAKRNEQDISAVCGAFAVVLDSTGIVQSARIAYGGMAAIPKRATSCETALVGQPWSRALIETAQNALRLDFAPLSDGRASAEYRQIVAANLLTRFWFETLSEDDASHGQSQHAMRLSDLIPTQTVEG